MVGDGVPDVSTVTSPPRRELGREEIEVSNRIGAGGQAVVYEARLLDESPPDHIALKEPAHSNTLTTEAVESFLTEARIWETVDSRERQKPRWRDSEHIVGVIDTGDQLPWIAMEYMDRGGLDDKLNANPRGLPLEKALWFGERIGRGVELAHNCGIAHLDLKPSNVLLSETADDTWAVPKIADWGLSRELTKEAGGLEGLSMRYAAPEQVEPDAFGDQDMLTDVYQLGAIVYAMLTGDPPYTGSQLSLHRDIISSGHPPAPSEQRDEIPTAVDRAVLTALEPEKADRYGSVGLLRQVLRALRTGEQPFPISQQPSRAESNEGDDTSGVSTTAVRSADSTPVSGYEEGHESTDLAPRSLKDDQTPQSGPSPDDAQVTSGSETSAGYQAPELAAQLRGATSHDKDSRPSLNHALREISGADSLTERIDSALDSDSREQDSVAESLRSLSASQAELSVSLRETDGKYGLSEDLSEIG